MTSDQRDICPELWMEKERLQAMVGLGRTLADPVLELDSKLQKCIEILAGLAGAERASLMMLEGEALVVRAATNRTVVGMVSDLAESSISTQVVRTGKPVYIKDVEDSSLAVYSRQGDQSSYRTGSLISLPLSAGGQIMGVLNLSDKEGAPYFDEKDLALAQTIATQVSSLVNFSALHSRLEAAYQDLRRAQKSKDDLMYMIFHDMKAPITGAKEILRLLGPGGGLSPDDNESYLALAEGDLELLWRRISNLLDLNRMDTNQFPLNPTLLELGELVEDAVQRLTAVSKAHGVDYVVQVEEPQDLRMDEDLIERIVVNLFFNALKFSSPEAGGGGKVSLRVSSQSDSAVLEVTDTGPGVDEKLGESIFERYKQGRITQGSTGLGLYFCRRAAWLLGGDISYRNLAEGGSRFTLRLPLEKEE